MIQLFSATGGVRRRPRRAAAAVILALTVTACGNQPVSSPEPPSVDTEHDTPDSSASANEVTPTGTKAGPPAAGTVLRSISGAGRINVISNGNGFTFVNSVKTSMGPDAEDQSAITTYDAAGSELTSIGSGFTGECGAADVVVAGKRTIVTELITWKPAQGISPETYSLDMTAWDARTGARLWQTNLEPESPDPVSCSAYDGNLDSFAATHDGKWSLYEHLGDTYTVIDLSTGAAREVPQASNVIGNYLAHDEPATPDSTTTIIDPATGEVLSSTSRNDIYFDNALHLATTPVFTINNYAPNVGLSADSTKVIVQSPNSSVNGNDVVVYELPTLKKLWSSPPDGAHTRIVAENGGLTLVARADSTERLAAYATQNGEKRWEIPYGEVCGMTTKQLMILVNDQLATIDLTTGKQLSYKEAPDRSSGSGCPTIVNGGLSLWQTSEGVDVMQELAP